MTGLAEALLGLDGFKVLGVAESEDELEELVLDVVVEEFARLLGLDPQIVDPGYPDDDEDD